MESHIKAARLFASLLETRFSFLGLKFGLDPLIGLIPIVGDFVGLILSAYIVWIGHRVKVPASDLARMWRNILFDLVLGAVPFIGDVSDFFYKASSKNLAILEKHLKNRIIEGEVVS